MMVRGMRMRMKMVMRSGKRMMWSIMKSLRSIVMMIMRIMVSWIWLDKK